MVLVIAVDNNNGMSFFGRPQSTDAVLTERIKKIENVHWLNERGIRPPFGEGVEWGKVDKVILFKWNRVYPTDKYFKWPANENFVLSSFENFEGSSHYITMEVYERHEN